jgi:hypothetical protein
MRPAKTIFFFGIMIFTLLGCGIEADLATEIPINPPPGAWIGPTGLIPRQLSTPTSPPVFLLPTRSGAATFPAWVADFSDPILLALNDQHPVIQDEFINVDKGWFYFIPDNPKGPYYAHTQNEALLLKLPSENEKRDYWVYNPRLLRKNFSLSFDLKFLESQPRDTVRFQFDQTADQSVAFDLSKNQTWTLKWGSTAEKQSIAGTYSNFPPERLTILVIVQDEECAFYINETPFIYLDDCRSEAVVRSSPWAVTFHIMAEPGHIAAATIDNLKFWDLDKIPKFP